MCATLGKGDQPETSQENLSAEWPRSSTRKPTMCNSRASQKLVKDLPARASDIQKLTGEVRISEQSVDSFCGVLDDVPRNSTLNRDRTKNWNNRGRYTRLFSCPMEPFAPGRRS